MSTIAPRGINILEIYDWYRQRKLLVNRRYQRKLVWSLEEKQKLIDSILLGYPLPLIFLAETEDSRYEIIDGMQRLNAIFSFIETSWYLKDKKYFDYKECPTAKLAADKGLFKFTSSTKKLSREECAKILNYQLAVTVFSVKDEEKINEIFSRINSSGRHLSNQEKRQAGVLSGFSELVRELSAEIRGDDSFKILDLLDMPVISIDTRRERHGYKISAEKTFWCHHGVLSTKDLRQSGDEEMIADISAGILSNSSFARSKENLDSLYKKRESQDIEQKLKSYGTKRLKAEIKLLFDSIGYTIKKHNSKSLAFRKTVLKKGSTANSAKTSFYAVFMAFYELMIKESKIPQNHKKIMMTLSEVNNRLKTASHHVTLTQRKNNIGIIKGLIQDYFVKEDKKQLTYKRGLLTDLENSLRRSKIETPHYEFKQGFLKLNHDRQFDTNLINKLAKTACGIANIHPEKEGFIHIGVTDKDADKIKKKDSITPKKIDGFYVVGIDREAQRQNKSLEIYVGDFVSQFKKTKLSEPLKSSILRNMDIIDYYGLSVIRLHIEAQDKLSYMDNCCFIREHSHTKEVTGQALEELVNFFNNAVLKKQKIKKRSPMP